MSHHFIAGLPLSDDLRQSLLRTAQGLRHAARERRELRHLAGRHLAIACEDPVRPDGDPVARAATGLGARVSFIPLDALAIAPGQDALARVLGSLYDAIDCRALSPERARELQGLASIPVFDGLARSGHPLHDLLATLDDGAGDADGENLNSLLQAALIEAMA